MHATSGACTYDFKCMSRSKSAVHAYIKFLVMSAINMLKQNNFYVKGEVLSFTFDLL